MACKTTFELHHNFPKLAEESGFTFNTHKPKVHIEWRKIKLIDIENLIRDRKFAIVEQHINDILDCVLESEFDVRILDEGVLKIFRLAQLAVEYQQFCRHYLDRSVFVLREEVTNLMQELDITKKNLREKEEETKRIRRKSKHFVRTPLPYGNENIAAMILKTLNHSKEDIFNSTAQLDAMQYNKCSYCEKVFLNQLYLKGHISRRHGHVLDIPQRDITDNHPSVDNTNEKLNIEVSELKLKLKQMEELIENSRKCYNPSKEEASPAEVNNKEPTKIENKETKDSEVLIHEEGFILEKIEEWKKEEHDKYNEEIKLLRQQIIDIISNKEKQDQTSVKNELKMIEELHATIKLQGDEILTLKHRLLNEESAQIEKSKEIEGQMSYWVKQAEMQSNEYKSLLQKLNEVANEAKEYRAQVHTEKQKAEHLQLLLQRHQNNTSPQHSNTKHKSNAIKSSVEKAEVEHEPVKTRNTHRNPTADVITLRKLQQKAQELLHIDNSSTSENSHTSNAKLKPKTKRNKEENRVSNASKQKCDNKYNQTISSRSKKNTQNYDKKYDIQKNITEEKKSKNQSKTDSHLPKKENGFVHIPASPIKVVRAKITEEVNNRLISLGVDPLKNRIPESIFKKQRKILQELQQAKIKKIPSREKILHSIMTHLDQNTTSTTYTQESNYVSPKRYPKTFSISSVLSNVKTKALALVKSNDNNNNGNKHNKSHDELAKTAIAMLKTPLGSNNSSPVMQRRYSVDLSDNNVRDILEEKKGVRKSRIVLKNHNKSREENNENNDETESSDGSEYESDDDKKNLDNTSKIINSLIKSPARRPADNNNVNGNHAKYKSEFIPASKIDDVNKYFFLDKDKNSSDGLDSIKDVSPKKNTSFEDVVSPKHTKGVLKNASSTSSLNKKKVLFDMDAIQMKSVSASPSQSITDKSDKKEQYELGIVNLDTEEWDISSIENEQLKSNTKIQISTRTSPKIAELKQTIESQLTRRNPNLSTAIIGGVDVLTTPMQKASFGGSNTSLGSSILDDDSAPIPKHNAFVIPKRITEKDDSEIEISDLIADTIVNKSYN